MRSLLRKSWQIYRDYFSIIAMVVFVIWVPLELLSSYIEAFVVFPG